MPTYYSQQIVGPSDIPTNLSSSISNFPRSPGDTEYPDYQQIVIKLNEGNFEPNNDYFIRLTLPRNKNFNLDYGIRLLTLPNVSNNGSDLDSLSNYQLIKYITVPQATISREDYNTVVLYQQDTITIEDNVTKDNWDTIYKLKNDTSDTNKVAAVHAAILIDESKNTSINSVTDIRNTYTSDFIANKMFKLRDNNYYLFSSDVLATPTVWPVEQPTEGNWIGSNSQLLTYSWLNETADDEPSSFDIMLRPAAGTSYDTIYLYLIPDTVDNDIQWRDGSNIYFGRHIDVSKVGCEIYKLTNLLSSISTVKNIGVWGRPELPMAINGAEIKIGPSGYYELKNYDITSLSIASLNNSDKYTVDLQRVES